MAKKKRTSNIGDVGAADEAARRAAEDITGGRVPGGRASASRAALPEPSRSSGLRRNVDTTAWEGPDETPKQNIVYSPQAGCPVDGVTLPFVTEATRREREQPVTEMMVERDAEPAGFSFEPVGKR